MVAALIFVAMSVFAIVVGLTSSTPAVEAVAPAAAFGILAVLTVGIERRRYGTFGAASPISLFAVFWFLFLGIMGLGVFGLSSTAAFGLTSKGVLEGLWIGVLGLAMVVLGYEITAHLAYRPKPRGGYLENCEDCPTWAIVAALSIGWLSTFYLFEEGQIGYLQFGQGSTTGLKHLALRFGSGLISLSLAALSAVMWSDRVFPSMSRAHARLLLWVNIPPLVLVSLGSGLKGQLLTSLVPVAIVYVLLRGRIPWKGVILMALYLIVSFGGIQQFRSNITTGELASSQTHGVLGPTRTAVSSVVSDWATASATSHFRLFWESATAEYSTIPQNLGLVVSRTPSPTPYLETRRYLTVPFFFLPVRTFEPPNFSLGEYVSVNYRGGTSDTATSPSQPGDLFMSGGIAGVVGGEIGVGVLIGLLWRVLAPSSARFRATVLYAVIAVGFASGGLDFVALARQAIEILLIYGPFCWLVFPRRTSAARYGPGLAPVQAGWRTATGSDRTSGCDGVVSTP